MDEVKEYIIKTSENKLLELDALKLKATIKEKFNVELPDDYIDFLEVSNGYKFTNNDIIIGDNILEETKKLKDVIDSWHTIDPKTFDNYVVIGTIYDKGYIVYLNKFKYYVLIENILTDFTLDGKDNKLPKMYNIYEVFIYYDYNVGNRLFEKKYNRIFLANNENKSSKHLKYQEAFNESIEKLDKDALDGIAIKADITIDELYKGRLATEDGKAPIFSPLFNRYDNGTKFTIYIYLELKTFGLICDEEEGKIITPMGLTSFKPPTNVTLEDRKNYYVVKSSEYEPIIIDKTLVGDLIKKELNKELNKDNKQSLFTKIKNFFKKDMVD